MRFLLITLLISSFTVTSEAQIARKKKLDTAIEALVQTEFIRSYKDYKADVETTMKDFKGMAYDLDPYDVEIVKESYLESKKLFDSVAESLKTDLIDKKTREFIINEPDRYSKFIGGELEDSYEYFLNSTVVLIDDYTGYQYTGVGLAEIAMIIDLIGELSVLLNDVKRNMKRMTAEYFEAYFIKDLRLAEWDDL